MTSNLDVQVDLKPSLRNASVQCDPPKYQKLVLDAGIQCNLPPTPGNLNLNTNYSVLEPEESDVSEASDKLSEMYQSCQESSPSYVVVAYICGNCMLLFFFNYRSDETSNTVHTAFTLERHTTYIVFESALLLIFTSCIYCASCSVTIKKIIIGSFLRVIQWYNKCKWKRLWESQPLIGNIPAGNILTSAAILYAGALPSKAIRVFEILNCSTISKKTFFVTRASTYNQQPA